MLRRPRRLWSRLVLLGSILGPGIITANIDNDAGGIATYSIAGAHFGYALLWTMVPATVVLIVVQEMASRMGVVTGKGLAALIRERFGVQVTFWLMVALLVTDLGNTTAEFAGWAASMELFGVSKYVSVPLGALFIWLLVVKGNLSRVRTDLPRDLCCVPHVCCRRRDGEAGLGGRRGAHAAAYAPVRCGVSLHDDRSRRHDHCPLDAVLPAIGDCGEGSATGSVLGHTHRRHGGLVHD